MEASPLTPLDSKEQDPPAHHHLEPKMLLPSSPNLLIPESCYFRKYQAFPEIEQIHQQAWENPSPKGGIAIFAEMNLLVKFGADVQIVEGQCLHLIREQLGDRVPVPEVYGWQTNGNDVYIFMQLVQGVTLEDRWDSLTDEHRVDICRQLREMLGDLRSLRQSESNQFIGQIDGKALQDIAIPEDALEHAGPFPSVASFNDWFSKLYRRHLDDPTALPPDPYRQALPNDVSVKFTHGDLHPSNILVSSSGTPRVASIIDWQQAGWLPEYWEVRKAIYTTDFESEWATRYIPMFLDEWADTWEAWDFYVSATGN